MKRRSGPRKTANLSASIHHQLEMYALAAGSAGVGMLALAQSAEAKIVYTPAHVKFSGQTILLDLNRDGQKDFSFRFLTWCTTGCENNFVGLWVAPATSANKVWATNRYYFASALPAGAVIGSKGKIVTGMKAMAGFDYNIYTYGKSIHSNGPWRDVKHRYLGLQFQAKDGLHYGWARLNVQCERSVASTGKGLKTTGLLTGYAYETIPGKSIKAGQTKESPDNSTNENFAPNASLTNPIPNTPQPATLGLLATGAPGLSIWRRELPGSQPYEPLEPPCLQSRSCSMGVPKHQ
jgi:hypothetical protein